MSQGAPAASKGPDISLVDLERELDVLLVEYESLSRAWPREPDILTRAKIGRRVEDALRRICELQHAIGTTQAKSLPDAAVRLRHLAVRLDEQDEMSAWLLASALRAVEDA